MREAGTGGAQVLEAGPDGPGSLTRRDDYRKLEFTHALTWGWMRMFLARAGVGIVSERAHGSP